MCVHVRSYFILCASSLTKIECCEGSIFCVTDRNIGVNQTPYVCMYIDINGKSRQPIGAASALPTVRCSQPNKPAETGQEAASPRTAPVGAGLAEA